MMNAGILGAPPKIEVVTEKRDITVKYDENETEQKRAEVIDNARNTNLAGYLLRKGVPLVRNGRRYKSEVHDSLVFTDNSYFWNSKQDNKNPKEYKGNAIDFLTRHMGFQFNEAVRELTGIDITNGLNAASHLIPEKGINTRAEIKKMTPLNSFSLDNLTLEKDTRRTAAYLNKTRHIDNMVIKKLFDAKYLYQQYVKHADKDNRDIEAHNILFPMYDEKGEVVGAETAGTLSYAGKRFKGVEEGSKYGYGFNIILNLSGLFDRTAPISKLYFFESSIDLISFIELEGKKDNLLSNSPLVSMAGLKKAVFDNMIKNFKCENAEKYICVDNDTAGLNFTALIKDEDPDMKILSPIGENKDWNEQLTGMKTHNTNNLDEWKDKIKTEKGNSALKDIENSKHYEQIEKI